VIVVDASVIAPALADDEGDGDRARRELAGEGLAAPELLALEVCQTFRRAARIGRLGRRRAEQAMSDLVALPIGYVPHRPLLGRIWELRENATAYDAAYLALAELMAAPLLTADGRLERVPGVRCPVRVLGPSS